MTFQKMGGQQSFHYQSFMTHIERGVSLLVLGHFYLLVFAFSGPF
jgi:hypothetical protein